MASFLLAERSSASHLHFLQPARVAGLSLPHSGCRTPGQTSAPPISLFPFAPTQSSLRRISIPSPFLPCQPGGRLHLPELCRTGAQPTHSPILLQTPPSPPTSWVPPATLD